jgi:hypothetical protein
MQHRQTQKLLPYGECPISNLSPCVSNCKILTLKRRWKRGEESGSVEKSHRWGHDGGWRIQFRGKGGLPPLTPSSKIDTRDLLVLSRHSWFACACRPTAVYELHPSTLSLNFTYRTEKLRCFSFDEAEKRLFLFFLTNLFQSKESRWHHRFIIRLLRTRKNLLSAPCTISGDKRWPEKFKFVFLRESQCPIQSDADYP